MHGRHMVDLWYCTLSLSFLCLVSIDLIIAFKVLYKESTGTVDRPSIKPLTKQSVYTLFIQYFEGSDEANGC